MGNTRHDKMETVKLLIFDMDGLMFETGRLSYQAYLKSAEKHDFEMTHNVYYSLTGKTESNIRKGMAELYGETVPYNEWRDSINDFKEKLLQEEQRVYKKKGLVELIQFAKSKEIIVGIASSTDRERIKEYLQMEDLTHDIDVIVAGDEISNGKPCPDIFLKVCEKTGILPEEALVLEDSIAGIEAANCAGIKSVLIEDDITDLPVRDGRYKLQKDISSLKKLQKASSDYQRQNLKEVIKLIK